MSFADKELLEVRLYDHHIYDFFTESVESAVTARYRNIVLYCCSVCLQLLDMKIFVDTDSDIRLVRRLRRDITERGRDIEGVIKQYNKFVKPAFEQYIEPYIRLADIVVPRGERWSTTP